MPSIFHISVKGELKDRKGRSPRVRFDGGPTGGGELVVILKEQLEEKEKWPGSRNHVVAFPKETEEEG